MKLLVFGRSGQVAQELAARAPHATCLGRSEADFADADACVSQIARHAPDVIINAAAWTAVDDAETAEELATQINGHTPGALARTAADRNIPFLHISTDYVFNGSGDQPWSEDDTPDPMSAYGRSKLEGERQVTSAGGRTVILRTAWVFSHHGSNFVKTMRRLGAERSELRVVDDQTGGPTAAGDIAETLLTIAAEQIKPGGATGIFHYAGQPSATWADFAEEIFRQSGMSTGVTRVPSKEYPTPARRPQNSRLDCSRLEQAYGIRPPDWRASLGKVISQLESIRAA